MVNIQINLSNGKILSTEKREGKGLGYNIEAFAAILTLFVFALGSLQSPAEINWNEFQTEVEARDIGHVMKETGELEGFLQRGETGSIQTAMSTVTDDQLQVSGNVRGLPIGEQRIGFHVNDDRIQGFETELVNGGCEGELSEIESTTEDDIRRTKDTRHGVRLYVANSDPEVVGDPKAEEDQYDTVWVDNGTECQFAAADGPYYEDEFFYWGDGNTGNFRDIKNIFKDGGKVTLYEADQTVRFTKELQEKVNGIQTDVKIDTFNFSKQDFSTYDVLVFRRGKSLDKINDPDHDRQERVMDYLEDNSVLVLADLGEDDFDSGLMSKTGMQWLGLDWTKRPEGAGFSNSPDSRKVRNLFKGQKPSGDVSLLPGGNVSSDNDRRLVYASSGFYETDPWNATNTSAVEINEDELPDGAPESDCTDGDQNYWKANFSFPEEGNPSSDKDYFVYGSRVECQDDIWSFSIDLEPYGRVEDEDVLLEGESVEVEGKDYHLISHLSDGADFVYTENQQIELVNYRENFPEDGIRRFARAGYEDNYQEQNRELLSAVIYRLASKQNRFGPERESTENTAVVGGIKNQVYMPYKLDMRWER